MSAIEYTNLRPSKADVTPEGTLGVASLFGVTFLALLVASLPNLADPMIRFDDYPAFFADPSGFWAKTLHEGRWINYLWHLREVVTPAWVNFAVYQALWAAFAAAVAVLALGRGGVHFFAVALALMIIVSPPSVLISLWFNTLIPGLAIVALYALLACRLSAFASRLLMPVFVILSFMAYTTYPLLILIVAVVRTRDRSVMDLIKLLALFTASFAGAVLTTYALNWQVHGIFGVPLADWREATPATDLAGYAANLPILWASLSDLLQKASYGFAPAGIFHLALLSGGLAVLARRAPVEALYLAAALVTGLSLVAVQVMKLGVTVPPRAFIFAWVIYAVIAVRAAQELSETPGLMGRLGRNAVLLIVLSYLLQMFQQYTTFRAWQAETRVIATAIAETADPIYVAGAPMQTRTAAEAGVQNDLGFVFRLQQITGRRVTLCDVSRCADIEGARTELGSAHVVQADGAVLVSFPD